MSKVVFGASRKQVKAIDAMARLACERGTCRVTIVSGGCRLTVVNTRFELIRAWSELEDIVDDESDLETYMYCLAAIIRRHRGSDLIEWVGRNRGGETAMVEIEVPIELAIEIQAVCSVLGLARYERDWRQVLPVMVVSGLRRLYSKWTIGAA